MPKRRLELVDKYRIPAVFSSPALRDVAALATEVAKVPMAAIQLVDDDQVIPLAMIGGVPEPIPRSAAFCDRTIVENKPLVIEDLSKIEAYFDHPLVARGPRFRFYAGWPLIAPSGDAIGTLCILDYQARSLNEDQIRSLERLSRVAMGIIDAQLNARAQQEAERTLEKERAFLAAVLENLADGVVACNAEGQLTLFNRALKEFHGLDSNSQLDPSEWSQYYRLYKADGVTLMEMADVPLIRILNGELLRDVEMVIVARDQTPRRFLASGRALYDKTGRKLGAVCAMHDVSEIKSKERDLVETNEALRAATAAKSEFLANMSHEIRTPLNGIVGMTALLMEDAVDESLRESLQVIQSSAENLNAIVGDVLDFSKIEAGMMEVEKRDFDLRDLLIDIARSFTPLASKKRIELRTRLTGDKSIWVVGDSVRIRQIVMNLVSNALKFTSSGFVEIELSTDFDDLEGVHAKIRVRDSGIGIDQETASRLFKPFAQADASTTRKYGGTGLGLSISKRLVELMGGAIGVESEIGRGACFWFSLNLQLGGEKGSQTAILLPEALPNLRVLLVEDNSVNQLIATRMLSRMGLEADVANNGVEAIHATSQKEYDVILMDCQMPEMDGYQATTYIRRMRNPNAQIPIIAMTANAMKGDRERCIEVGMTDYISKPFKIEELREKLNRLRASRDAAS